MLKIRMNWIHSVRKRSASGRALAMTAKRIMPIIIFSLLVILLMSSCSKSTKPDDDFEIDAMGTITFDGEKWIVLDMDHDRLLILSQFILFTSAYNQPMTADITWETSSIREYLNNTYYNSINADSRALIQTTTIENPDNPWYGTDGGNDTEDKIFLLSLQEVCKYFGGEEQLYNRPGEWAFLIDDEYNENRIARQKNMVPEAWWLRSTARPYDATFVSRNGRVYVSGLFAHIDDYGVRPAMWISRK